MGRTWQRLRHNGKADPGDKLVGVVGTGHEVEERVEWIAIRKRNAALFRAGRSQVAKQPMNGEVT